MDIGLKNIEEILDIMPRIIKDNYGYWVGETGEYHRSYLLQWYEDSKELIAEMRKEIEDGN